MPGTAVVILEAQHAYRHATDAGTVFTGHPIAAIGSVHTGLASRPAARPRAAFEQVHTGAVGRTELICGAWLASRPLAAVAGPSPRAAMLVHRPADAPLKLA